MAAPFVDGRLAHIVMGAELDGVVCSGPRRGKQTTSALLAERAPTAKSLPREMALAELAHRSNARSVHLLPNHDEYHVAYSSMGNSSARGSAQPSEVASSYGRARYAA